MLSFSCYHSLLMPLPVLLFMTHEAFEGVICHLSHFLVGTTAIAWVRHGHNFKPSCGIDIAPCWVERSDKNCWSD